MHRVSCKLMWSMELQGIKDAVLGMGVGPTAAGFIAGAGGGICQASVCSQMHSERWPQPCTLTEFPARYL